MKSLIALLVLAVPFGVTQAAPQTEQEKTVYALGLAISGDLKNFALSPEEITQVIAGLTDGLRGNKPAVDLAAYKPKIGALAAERAKKRSAGARKEGAAYLTKAAQEKGAVRTESGLIFTTLRAGTGAQPKPTDTVKVNYRGTLIDGTEFDSSYKRGEPTSFPLNRVVKCWTEGVGRMKVGEKARLVCPADIAYGDRGAPPVIPPGATLIFEVELLSIGG